MGIPWYETGISSSWCDVMGQINMSHGQSCTYQAKLNQH